MTPLPGALGGAELVAWRLEMSIHFPTWSTAEGAFRVGGRWSSAGRRILYASIDPATTILEVAVHKGLHVLDTVPHTLLSIEIADPFVVHVVDPAAIPNPNWLRPGTPSAGQQQFGDAVLAANPMALFPSVVSQHSWNLLLDVDAAAGSFRLHGAEAFALDPRLNPPARAGAKP